MFAPISKAALARLPDYLRYLSGKDENSNISSVMISEDLKLNAVLVRKDLAIVSMGGKPKTGYVVGELIRDLKAYLGYDNVTEVILVGVGHLGKALLSYNGFSGTGMKIVAAFDNSEELIGQKIGKCNIFDVEKLSELVKRLKIRIGIITVPASAAQNVANLMVEAGISAIWNFAPLHLAVPIFIAVKNEDLAASLAILTKQIT